MDNEISKRKYHNQKSAKILGKRWCTICDELKDISNFRTKSAHCLSCNPKSQLRIKVEENKNLFQQGKRRCSRCKVIKSLDDFGKDKHRTYGYSSYCLECIRKYYGSNLEYIKHKEEMIRLRLINKKRCIRCKEIKDLSGFNVVKKKYHDSYCRKCRNLVKNEKRKKKLDEEREFENSLLKKKQWKCKKCLKIKSFSEFGTDKRLSIGIEGTCKKCRNLPKQNKRLNYPKKRLDDRIAAAIRRALSKRKVHKNNKTWDILDFTLKDLIKHLESRFTDGMSWDNMHLWHIDHIRPISSFNYKSTDDPEFKECWSLSNLQPLWAEDNIRKGSKILD